MASTFDVQVVVIENGKQINAFGMRGTNLEHQLAMMSGTLQRIAARVEVFPRYYTEVGLFDDLEEALATGYPVKDLYTQLR